MLERLEWSEFLIPKKYKLLSTFYCKRIKMAIRMVEIAEARLAIATEAIENENENIKYWMDRISPYDSDEDYIFMIDSFLEYCLRTFEEWK